MSPSLPCSSPPWRWAGRPLPGRSRRRRGRAARSWSSPTRRDPIGTYYAEILRAEGLNEFAVRARLDLSAATLAGYQVVLLAETSVTDAQAALLDSWVQGGGNLIAMRPDAPLAGLLGLGSETGVLDEAYIKVATGSPPGAGITAETMQFHGTADRWSTAGAATVATLYSDADTATSNPAVTLRNVGAAGGQAAAFTYDLARSVVATRQGNWAWAGAEARRRARRRSAATSCSSARAASWTSARSRSRRPTSSSGCWPTSSRR